MKQKVEDLNRKIQDKNTYMARLEEQKKELDTLNAGFNSRFHSIQRELKKSKEQIERLTLRTVRGAPYYQIIQEFFPNDAHKFVDKEHLCICSTCLKEFTQGAET